MFPVQNPIEWRYMLIKPNPRKKTKNAPNAKNGPKGSALFIVFLPLKMYNKPTAAPDMNAKAVRKRISGQPKINPSGIANFTSPIPIPLPFVRATRPPKNNTPSKAPTTRLIQIFFCNPKKIAYGPKNEKLEEPKFAAEKPTMQTATMQRKMVISSGMIPSRISITESRKSAKKKTIHRTERIQKFIPITP